MVGKIGVIFAVLLFVTSFVYAYTVDVEVLSEPRLFKGATMKIQAPGASESEDKIFPSENYAMSGVLRFHFETELKEADMIIRFSSDGEVVEEYLAQNLDMTKSSIFIDLRGEEEEIVIGGQIVKGAGTPDVVIEDVESNQVEDKLEENLVSNASEDLDLNEGDFDSNERGSGITGFVVSALNSEYRFFYFLGIGFIGTFVAVFLIVRMAFKSGARAELRNLGRMELDRRLDQLE